MSNMSYINREECHKDAKIEELYHRAVCEVCGEEYDKKDEETKKKVK